MNLKLNTPIRKTLIANLFYVGVNLLNQIVLVPFYLVYWGKDLYSDWIVLSALSSIFSMSDMGISSVIQNRFSIKMVDSNYKECKSLLINNILIISFVFFVCIFLCIMYLCLFDITKDLNIHILNRKNTSLIFILLIIGVFVCMYSSIENAIYRAFHNTCMYVLMDSICKLSITIITFVVIVCHISLVWLAFFIIIPNLINLIIKHIHVQRYFKYEISYSYIDFKLLKVLLFPSFTFMLLPIGNMIILQGFTLVVNKYFGAGSVVLFNTTRTMCNFVKTFLGIIRNSIWPELSISYGLRDYIRMRDLYLKLLIVVPLLSVFISVLLMLFGPFIYQIWTHGMVQFSYSLMLSFLIVLFFNNLWNSAGVVLMATNHHSRMGLLYIILSILSLLLSLVFANKFHSLEMLVYCLLLVDLFLSIYVVYSGFLLIKSVKSHMS